VQYETNNLSRLFKPEHQKEWHKQADKTTLSVRASAANNSFSDMLIEHI
jgi:hypothetical protein